MDVRCSGTGPADDTIPSRSRRLERVYGPSSTIVGRLSRNSLRREHDATGQSLGLTLR